MQPADLALKANEQYQNELVHKNENRVFDNAKEVTGWLVIELIRGNKMTHRNEQDGEI